MELGKVLEKLEESVTEELEKLVKKPELNPAEIKAATDGSMLVGKDSESSKWGRRALLRVL